MKFTKSLNVAVVAAALMLSNSAARAQFYNPSGNNPNNAQQPQAASLASARTQAYAAGVTAGTNNNMTAPPYYPGYYPGTSSLGVGGALNGVAAVTNANGQYQVQIQQARMAQSQADLSKLDVRAAIKQESQYERSLLPDPEQVRIAEINASLSHSRFNPPPTEIWDATAMNDLYTFAQSVHRQGVYGPYVPLTPEMLQNINVTTGVTRGSTAGLFDGRPPKWTVVLKRPDYKDDRDKLEKLMADLYKQGSSQTGIDNDMLVEAEKTANHLVNTLKSNIAELTPDEYVGSKRLLGEISQSLKVLEDPNAGNYITKKWSARGNSIAELYDEMTRSGLKFAPCVRGAEPSYTVLYNSMLTYDIGLQRMTGAVPVAKAPSKASSRRH